MEKKRLYFVGRESTIRARLIATILTFETSSESRVAPSVEVIVHREARKKNEVDAMENRFATSGALQCRGK